MIAADADGIAGGHGVVDPMAGGSRCDHSSGLNQRSH